MGSVTAVVERRDPDLRSLKRAVRAAVVVPVAFAAGRATGQASTAVFALFGSFALTLMVDFVAPPARRRRAYVILVAVGGVLVVVGTLCSRSAALGVPVMAVVAFAVLFGSLVGPLVVQAIPATLLMLVLPICLPAAPSAVGPRLAGLAIAAAVSVPAVLLVWPTPHRARLRRALAETASALSSLARAHAEGVAHGVAKQQADASWDHLLEVFELSAYPPAGAAPGDEALLALVSQLGQVKVELALAEGTTREALHTPEMARLNAAGAAVLDLAAGLLRRPEARAAAELDRTLAALRHERERSRSAEVHRLATHAVPLPGVKDSVSSASSGYLIDAVDPTFRGRSLALALEVAGHSVLHAGAMSEERLAARLDAFVALVRPRLASRASSGAVWLHNALRGALALSLAVLVVQLAALNHGFWVVLGTLSVLRSNAAGTGSTVLRAVAGTVVGVVVGSLIVAATGGNHIALWALLPLAVGLAGFAPSAISFAAGQAAFTFTVLVAFTIEVPEGLHLGIIRAEDVAIGAAVALGVGLLFWPRGASRALGQALSQALATATSSVRAGLERLVAVGSSATDVEACQEAADEAGRRLDDAFRQYLMERGAKTVAAEPLTRLFVGTNRVRVFGEMLAGLPVEALPEAVEDPPALRSARGDLQQAFQAVERFSEEAGATLSTPWSSGRERGIRQRPIGEARSRLHRQLLAALQETAAAADQERVSVVLRMLWADQALDDLADLEESLGDAVEVFARRPSSWSWAARHL